jgi:hypothetical protein
MKKQITVALLFILSMFIMSNSGCDISNQSESEHQEQKHIEQNQQNLNNTQPAPFVSWSLERDNLIKRFKLMNDRTVMFYMYIFIEGSNQPIGYYQINKISSVNSQLTSPMQLVQGDVGQYNGDFSMPAPAIDGSYGENGNAMFGFSPDGIYLESNMHYIVSTIPLEFNNPVKLLAIVNTEEKKQLLNNSLKITGK